MKKEEIYFLKEQTAYYVSTGMDMIQARLKAEQLLKFLNETGGLKPEDYTPTKGL